MNRLVLMVLKNLGRVPGAFSKLCRYAKRPENYSEEEMWRHIRYVMQLAAKGGNVNLVVSGQENIPQEGGVMLYGNHQGLFDVVAIAASCQRPLGIVYKKELTNAPLLKQIFACTRSFAMDREDVRQSLTVIQAVTGEVKKGRAYVIFPEGTRSKRKNQMIEFHGGSFRCALKGKCPIVPMALIDSYRALDEKGSKPLTVQIHYLPAIPYEEFADLKAQQVAELVKFRIAEAIDKLTVES